MNSEQIKFTEVKNKRLLKATPMERKKLLFGDNSYNEYVAGVGLSLQRDCRLPCSCPILLGWFENFAMHAEFISLLQ